MAFKIKKTSETDIIATINILIYGEPGSGKTSLASTSNKSILLDFDNGSYRSEYRQDRIRITDWQKDILNNLSTIEKDFQDYETIIIDTIETALECLGAWIIKTDNKYAMPKYKLQYYGRLKDEFSRFISIMNSLGKDVIQIAHVKEKDEGDLRIKRPQITGGTYDKILQISDFVGYQSINNGMRKINFSPTEFHVGKNSAKFDLIEIPNFKEEPEYFKTVIKDMKLSLGELALTHNQALEKVTEFTKKINKIKDAEIMNEMLIKLANEQKIVKKQLWEVIQKRAEEINIEYHKANGQFYTIEEEK